MIKKLKPARNTKMELTMNTSNNLILFSFFIYLLSFVFCLSSCSEPTDNHDNGCTIPDTTDHNFTWAIDTIGEYGSYLKDVAVISQDEVWAVGEIYKNEERYSAAIWNGDDWILKKLIINNSIVNMESILVFSYSNIWFAAGSIVHWDGNSVQNKYVRDIDSGEFITNLWGTPNGYIVGIGTAGSLVVYNGTQWKRFPNITDRDLNDVKGIVDPKTGNTKVWVGGKTTMLYSPDGENWQVVWDLDHPLFEDNFINVNALYIPDECHIVASVWNGTKSRLYLIKQNDFTDFQILAEHKGFAHDMDGHNMNDVFIAGSFTIIEHYNGSSIIEFPQFTGRGWNTGVSYFNNSIFIAGTTMPNYQGIVVRGKSF